MFILKYLKILSMKIMFLRMKFVLNGYQLLGKINLFKEIFDFYVM